MKLQFSVDALHIIEQMAAEAEAPGIVFGLQLMHCLLQKVAERAVELNDKKMLGYMMRLHLVDEVEKKEGGK